MKQQMTTSIGNYRSHFFVLLALVLNLFVPAIAFAQGPADEVKPFISYIGKSNGQPIVQVAFENNNESNCKIILQDPEGNVLYATSFKDKSFQKKFLIDNVGAEDIQLTITLYSGNTKSSQVVKINNNTFTNQSFSITKL
jgi:hypothetical protein